jgi:hypothetical protein
MLHFNQLTIGGCQHTSNRKVSLGWCMLIENCFKRMKSLIEVEEVFVVLLPDNAVLDMIIAIAEFQGNNLLLNLA